MADKSCPCNLAVVLIVGLIVGISTFEHATGESYFDLKLEDTISPQEFMDIIEGSQSGTPTQPGALGSRVAQNLAKISDKHKPNAILDEFSVDQLLKLNEWYKEDCTHEEIEKRKDMCDQIDKSQSYREAKRKLVEYCRELLDAMATSCQPELIQEAANTIPQENNEAIQELHERVRFYIESVGIDKEQVDLRDVIRQVKGEMEQSDEEKVRFSCNLLITKLEVFFGGQFIDYKIDEYSPETAFEYCEIFNTARVATNSI
jgi:hypothetical protein